MSDGRLATRVVWKIPLLGEGNGREWPELAGAVPRHVGLDGDGVLCCWVEHDRDRLDGRVPLALTIVGTGQRIPEGGRYVGTVVVPDSGLVWHVYDGGRW